MHIERRRKKFKPTKVNSQKDLCNWNEETGIVAKPKLQRRKNERKKTLRNTRGQHMNDLLVYMAFEILEVFAISTYQEQDWAHFDGKPHVCKILPHQIKSTQFFNIQKLRMQINCTALRTNYFRWKEHIHKCTGEWERCTLIWIWSTWISVENWALRCSLSLPLSLGVSAVVRISNEIHLLKAILWL